MKRSGTTDSFAFFCMCLRNLKPTSIADHIVDTKPRALMGYPQRYKDTRIGIDSDPLEIK